MLQKLHLTSKNGNFRGSMMSAASGAGGAGEVSDLEPSVNIWNLSIYLAQYSYYLP
jgi:hypothetical protein